MLSILVNAYACSPSMGSEPGMAWNWCVNLANYCDLHIITEGEFRDKIEAMLPTLPQGKNMHLYYNPVPDSVRKMCWNQGDWRFYKYYKKWQWKTYQIAKDIVSTHHIDVLHQLNMIGFREPGYLWKIKGIPFVWGPVDAKDAFPVSYLKGTSLKNKLFIRLKNLITWIQLKYDRRVCIAVKNACCVISASSNSQRTFKTYFNIDSPLLNETGCNVNNKFDSLHSNLSGDLNILWVGKMDFRKQLSLALNSIAATNNRNLKLHIIGGGNIVFYKGIASNLGIEKQCIWYGNISHDRVQFMMRNCNLFFFTSVAEGTPHVVLESIFNDLPVLCFNTCGQGDSVNDKVGRKIELSNPKQSIKEFALILNQLEQNRGLLKEMSLNCKQRQQELSWDNKAKQMVELYKKSILKRK